jgi:hypothetical protein
MADQHPYPDSNGDTGVETGRGSPPGIPLWVKVFAGGGSHGPGRHIPSSDAGNHIPLIAHGVQRP